MAPTLQPKPETADSANTRDRALAENFELRVGPAGAELTLEATISHPVGRSSRPPVAILVHGFPSGTVSASKIGADLPELADRIATNMGWQAICPRMRGCGKSDGDFSLAGWVADVDAAVAFALAEFPESSIWIVGFGTGGAVGLSAATHSELVGGAAVLATPADFVDWANRPDQLIVHSRKVGAIKDANFPQDRKSWRNELQQVSTVEAARRFSQKPLLVLHGSDDELVPALDARAVADAHAGADLRIINGAGHQLRHDPRALAMLLGWLDRQSQL